MNNDSNGTTCGRGFGNTMHKRNHRYMRHVAIENGKIAPFRQTTNDRHEELYTYY